ncbi:MAG: hypothetical protein V6Z81_09150 [Parvularculales bacterium]
MSATIVPGVGTWRAWRGRENDQGRAVAVARLQGRTGERGDNCGEAGIMVEGDGCGRTAGAWQGERQYTGVGNNTGRGNNQRGHYKIMANTIILPVVTHFLSLRCYISLL